LDATYVGGSQANVGADPIGRLLKVGNQGGFRFSGGSGLDSCRLAVLYTDGRNLDWPDYIDHESGRFVYFGDNRTPGAELHDTPRGGNTFLREVFSALHSAPSRRDKIPPVFVFEKGTRGRDVIYRGLVAPGSDDTTPIEDLVAVWKSTRGSRFQNYRATFTILDCEHISRVWIDSIARGETLGLGCPDAWKEWVATGRYRPLRAERTTVVRTKAEQLPETEDGVRVIRATHKYFSPMPHFFESCAARLWRMSAPSTTEIDVTRPSRDGGRDAVGRYALGPVADRIHIDFALEAKCYEMDHGSGVRDISRLVSRLRHRQFGVFVTTSYVSEQAYEEIRQDQHPVVIMAARDIVETLRREQRGSEESVLEWLRSEFPTN